MSESTEIKSSTDLEPARDERRLTPWLPPLPGFFLTVSRVEVSLQDGDAYLKAQRHHVEDGRVVTERLEGHVGPEVYGEMLQAAEQQMRGVMKLMQVPMRLFMPWLSGPWR